ncbi:DUF1684 domain-containing protein [Shivajiella indica]|uniref:DUF1684 domain-containing protein n=1 Tax=Shivajiella indica TaxID=872115 RepID=A0ABW5B6D3_9BACT
MKKPLLKALILLPLVFSCQKNEILSEEEHRKEIEAWHEEKMTSLKAENGWLNLIGLYWLEEGGNSFGSGESMDFKLENSTFPVELGVFFLEEGKVYFEPLVNEVKSDGIAVEGKTLIFDAENKITKPLSYKSLHWLIIKRADAYGVRLRDYEAESVRNFKGVEQFPIDLNWRLQARFIPYESSKTIAITNVIGQTTQNPCPGYLEFEIADKTFRLDALEAEEEDELFLIFADETSGRETYGGGRYMYVKRADVSGRVILDFNKAYNPPCVYTPHATCPLPPRQNMLDVAISAGHKNYGDH